MFLKDRPSVSHHYQADSDPKNLTSDPKNLTPDPPAQLVLFLAPSGGSRRGIQLRWDERAQRWRVSWTDFKPTQDLKIRNELLGIGSQRRNAPKRDMNTNYSNFQSPWLQVWIKHSTLFWRTPSGWSSNICTAFPQLPWASLLCFIDVKFSGQNQNDFITLWFCFLWTLTCLQPEAKTKLRLFVLNRSVCPAKSLFPADV